MNIKPTDIPNGYVVLGPSGTSNILVDFDEQGKAETKAVGITISGWPETILDKGLVRPEILVLVHTVKGAEQILVKRLRAMQLALDGKPTSVKDVARLGKLTEMAENIWNDYMINLSTLDHIAQTIVGVDKAQAKGDAGMPVE